MKNSLKMTLVSGFFILLTGCATFTFQFMSRADGKIYVGSNQNSFSKLFPIKYETSSNENEANIAENKKAYLSKYSKEIDFSRDDIERVSITFVCTDTKDRPSNEEMLQFTNLAEIHCSACVDYWKSASERVLVTQGYDCGEYDTGFYVDQNLEYYSQENISNNDLYELQHQFILNQKFVD